MPRKIDEYLIIETMIGKKIEQLRIERGLSRQQLGKKVGVSPQQIAKYVSGTDRISAGRLHALAKALDVAPAIFFEDSYEPLPTQHTRMCIEVSRNFMKIKSSVNQVAVNFLVKELSLNN